MSGSPNHRIELLDREGCRVLADTLGDTSRTIIATQLLGRGLCRAYVVGDPARFEGAIIQARDFPGEPTGYGSDPSVRWKLLCAIEGWFRILVSTECAPAIGERMEREMGAAVRYLDDICCELHGPVPRFDRPSVRVFTLDDLSLLEAAAPDLRASCYGDTEDLLHEGIVACAIVSGKIVATALTAARSKRYAEIGVYTDAPFRGRGYATAAASLVCRKVQEAGQTPVWSAGAHNTASLRIAQKLDFTEVSRGRYVIHKERESTAGR